MILFSLPLSWLLVAAGNTELPPIEIVAGQAQPAEQVAASVTQVDAETLAERDVSDPAELSELLPATLITDGSGKEHLIGLRSPVLTGAGACGAFAFLENGVPVRPSGFCNVNQLLEYNLRLLRGVEVLRGPGPVRYGSNAQHGAFNMLLADPLAPPPAQVSLSVDHEDQFAIDTQFGARNERSGWWLGLSSNRGNSFRRDEAHEREGLQASFAHQGDWRHDVWLSAVQHQQDTAGYILGEAAYADAELRTSNPNPEAFRELHAERLAWRIGFDEHTRLTSYVRHSDMDFRMHFLPGKPLEENGHHSAGLQFDSQQSLGKSWDLRWGAQAEWARGYLRQTQDSPSNIGVPAVDQTRPLGAHYDFDFGQQQFAVFADNHWQLQPTLTFSAGLRAEWIRYDYDNHLAPGNLREDGTACPFGGCVYYRPADRSDDFINLRPTLALMKDLDFGQISLRLARGYRAPQVAELYRLERGQRSDDIDQETLDSVELSWRAATADHSWQLALYAMRKRNVIFETADGQVVDNGETRHRGLEWQWQWQISEQWRFQTNGTLADHEYGDWPGAPVRVGARIDGAPALSTNSSLSWQPSADWTWTLRHEYLSDYPLSPELDLRYEGHNLWHVGVAHELSEGLNLQLQWLNASDEYYAERADYAFGNYRYFPGPRAHVRARLSWRW